VKLAMKIGDKYKLHDIDLSQWRKLAADVHFDTNALIDRVRAMAAELPDRLADEIRRVRAVGISHRTIDALAQVLPNRAARIACG
jgi:hypothetical protein